MKQDQMQAAFSEPVHPSSDAPDLAESRLRVWRSDITRNLPADAAFHAFLHGSLMLLPQTLVKPAPFFRFYPLPTPLAIATRPCLLLASTHRGRSALPQRCFHNSEDSNEVLMRLFPFLLQPCVGSRISSFAEGCIVARPTERYTYPLQSWILQLP